MTLPSRHRIRNSSPGGLRPSTLPLGHGGSPQYWLSHVDGEETFFVSFKPPRSGTEPRTLAWKAAVLTTTPGPPPPVDSTQESFIQYIYIYIYIYILLYSFCCIYMIYGYPGELSLTLLTALGSILVVRIWRLWTSDSDDQSRSPRCKGKHIYNGSRPIK